MSTEYTINVVVGCEVDSKLVLKKFFKVEKGAVTTEDRYDPKTGEKLAPVKIHGPEHLVWKDGPEKTHTVTEVEIIPDLGPRHALQEFYADLGERLGCLVESHGCMDSLEPEDYWGVFFCLPLRQRDIVNSDGFQLNNVYTDQPIKFDRLCAKQAEAKQLLAKLKKLGLKPDVLAVHTLVSAG